MHDAVPEPQSLAPLLLQHFQVVNLWTQDRAKSDIWSVPEFEQYLAAETGGPAAFDDFWDQVQRVTSEALHAAQAVAAEAMASNRTKGHDERTVSKFCVLVAHYCCTYCRLQHWRGVLA